MAAGPAAVSINDKIKGLTAQDESVLWAVGTHLGGLASADLKRRCAGAGRWAERKRDLTPSSSRPPASPD
ncbi:hypothetical protein GCM10027447_21910 [Glycomyces halotolerans]